MRPGDDEELCEIRTELERIIGDYSEIWQRQLDARRLRFCEWDGQSDDGRKHETALGEPALPFEGAPDSRIPLVDLNVNDKVAVVTTAFFRAQIQAVAIEPSDMANAANVTTMLRWLRGSEMRKELREEVELAAQWMFGDDPGLAIMEIKWLQDTMLQRRDLSFEELATLYVTGEQNPDSVAADDPRLATNMLADFQDLAMNPIREREFMQWLGSAFAGASEKALRRAVRDLRKTGAAELPIPVLRENRPSVQTLRLGEDIFFPVGTTDIQRCRSYHRREWLNETELRERVITMGWDADCVEQIIDKGKGQTLAETTIMRQDQQGSVSLSAPGAYVNEHDHLFEIWWSFERRPDEDLGVPGIFCTVWNCVVRDCVLKTELVDYKHGLYPIALRTRERVGRQVTDSRGLGRPIATHQAEVKTQRDARGVHIQLTASPPSKTKASRGTMDLILGPNAQNPVTRMDDWELVNLPSMTADSVQMEAVAKGEADEYCGRQVEGHDPNRAALIQQRDADNFLALMVDVFAQVLALCQQFYTPAELARITGSDMASPLQPEDIRGSFDVMIEIDARDLNMEFAMKKLDAFTKIATLDIGGQFDRAPWLESISAGVDPITTRKSIRPQENVTAKEIDATKSALAQMAVGIEPDMPTAGINPKIRMQTLSQQMQASPRLTKQYAVDPNFKALLDNYQKYLVQQDTQNENKVVGRLGTAPLQGVGQSAALGG